jgi:hypothetical protein
MFLDGVGLGKHGDPVRRPGRAGQGKPSRVCCHYLAPRLAGGEQAVMGRLSIGTRRRDR